MIMIAALDGIIIFLNDTDHDMYFVLATLDLIQITVNLQFDLLQLVG